MNSIEKIILAIGALVLALIILFPPWMGAHPSQPQLVIHLPRAFVGTPPHSPGTLSIDWRELIAEIVLTLLPVFLLNMLARWLFSGDLGPPGWPGTIGPVPATFYRPLASPNPQHLLWFPIGCPHPRLFVLVATTAAQQERPIPVAYVRLKNAKNDLWAWTVGGGDAGTTRSLPQAMASIQASLANLQLDVALTPLARSLNGLSLPVPHRATWWHHVRFAMSVITFMMRFLLTLVPLAGSRRSPSRTA